MSCGVSFSSDKDTSPVGLGSTSSSLTYLLKDLVSKYIGGKGFNTCLLGVHILSITLVLLNPFFQRRWLFPHPPPLILKEQI